MRKSLLRVLPWLVTAGLLFLLFRRISIAEVVADTRRAAGWMVPVTLAVRERPSTCADSFAIWKTFGWFLARMSVHGRAARCAGATYLLAAINYNVGQGAIVYFVHRTAGTPDHATASRPSSSMHGHQRAGAAVPGDGRPRHRARRSPAR